MTHQEQFITERKIFRNVTAQTVGWYKRAFKAFDGALDSKATVGQRIAELREHRQSAISVNCYLAASTPFSAGASRSTEQS